MIVPVVDGVTVAVQLAVVALTTVNGLLQALNVPVAVPPFVMATDPAGVEAVPGEMLSLTNTVHVTCWPTATEAGEDRKSVVEGKSVDLGGRRIIKTKMMETPYGAG